MKTGRLVAITIFALLAYAAAAGGQPLRGPNGFYLQDCTIPAGQIVRGGPRLLLSQNRSLSQGNGG